jgi:ABC-type transport system substrate-binding protein/class 3 adenylate cyclase
MAELPTGTVTFLFTDIEGSTILLQRLGDGYPEVMADHQRLLRQSWADHDGHEIDTQGDSFFVVFARATDAIAAAAQAQQALAAYAWPAGEHVRVRMGLHTGVGTLSQGHYVGLDVHRAARVAAAGHGGQVLLSRATRDQVAKELVVGEGLRDLGRHRLKDLPRREELYQLDLPGLPTEFPPLKTLDAWPGLRADLTVVTLVSVGLLAIVGLLLPLIEPAFPRWIGLGAAGLAALLLVTSGVARPVRHALRTQWRDARKPFATLTSMLLSLVLVLTTLFITKPPIIIKPAPYIFSYTYHAPTHIGGAITAGLATPLFTLAPPGLTASPQFNNYFGLWQSCLIQLPDVSLGLASYQPDQCQEVPTIANGLESIDGTTTTFRIDPRAVWSDGIPVTADDYLFSQQLYADPNVCGCLPPALTGLTAPDPHTVQMHWSAPFGDYLAVLASLTPVPLHVYATGQYANIYTPSTGAYDSALAQTLVASADYNSTFPVDDGPFTVRSFVPYNQAVLVRNPRFFSNYLHKPALDQVTFVAATKDFPASELQNESVTFGQMQDDMIAAYRKGGLDNVQGLVPPNLNQLQGIPASEVITSPNPFEIQFAFNQRSVAPNAGANGGASMFTDRAVRQAFWQAFDRCGAMRAVLGIRTCADPNLFSDELTTRPSPDYDPTVQLPGYDPVAAAALLDRAGYLVVNGVRRAKDGTSPMQLVLGVGFGATVGNAPAIAVRMQQDFAKNLHISVSITTVKPNLAGNAFYTGAFDLALVAQPGSSDPVGALPQIGGGGAWDSANIPSPQNPNGSNTFGVVDPYVIAQDHLGAQVIDSDQRAAVYRALQRHVSGLLDIIPVYVMADIALNKPTLCNYKKSTAWNGNRWNMADWYVAPSCPA